MAPKAINYENTHFYKLCCKDLNIKECYIGHTTDFIRRKAGHKYNCNNEKANFTIYMFMNLFGIMVVGKIGI